MRQEFNHEDKRVLRQFGFSIILSIVAVITVLLFV